MNFDKLKIKNRPIAFQIWLIMGVILGLTAIIFSIILPFVIRKIITEEKFDRVVESQEFLLSNFEYPYIDEKIAPHPEMINHNFDEQKDGGPPIKFSRIVRHFYLSENGEEVIGDFDQEILKGIIAKVFFQEEKLKQYNYNIDDKRIIYYLVRKIAAGDKNGYLVSYIHSYYRDSLFQEIFKRMTSSLFVVLILSWLVSIFIAGYLTKSLRILKEEVKKIANREWNNPIKIDRNDEIGEVAKSIEWMRRQLLIRDKNQQDFLQEISHEIKTPIMVLRSYIQSMQDGIYPKEDLDGTLNAMETESYKMEKRIKSLINITKIDFLSRQNLNRNKFNLTEVLNQKMESLSWRRKDVNWIINALPLQYYGDQEKLTVALENIIDNQFKYAASIIKVNVEKSSKALKLKTTFDVVRIKFWNDGYKIEKEKLEHIFNKFTKGESGEYGLGLAITRIIIEAHEGKVWAENEDKGVAFYIELEEK